MDMNRVTQKLFWLWQELKESVSVRPSVPKCSFFIFLAQIFKLSISSQPAVSQLFIILSEPEIILLIFWLRQELKESVCSKVFFLHLSGSNLQAVDKQSASRQSVSYHTVRAWNYSLDFLAPTGAQGVTICVRPCQSALPSSFLLKSSSNQSEISQKSVSSPDFRQF